MPKAYPEEFRSDVVRIVRSGQASLKQVAEDFGIAESCLRRWLRQDDFDDGVRPGVSRDEAKELREARRRIRLWGRKTKCCGGRRRICHRRI